MQQHDICVTRVSKDYGYAYSTYTNIAIVAFMP